MLYDTGFDHDTGANLFPAFGIADEGPLPTTDWAQALLDHRATRNGDQFLGLDEPLPEMPPFVAFDSELRKSADAFIMFGEGEEELPETEVEEVIVEGVRRVPGSAVSVTIGDTPELPVDGGGGGGEGPVIEEDDDCPYTEAYEDAAGTVGMLADVLKILKDSPASIGSRDDRAVSLAIQSLEALEASLMTGQISLTSLEGTVASIFEIMMNESSDTVIVGLGTAAGVGVAWWMDGPLPVGEILGGIAGAVAAFVAGQFISHRAVAEALAKAVLDHLNIEDIDGPCNDD